MNILKLITKERKNGFNDSAVFGGFSAYLEAWASINSYPDIARLASRYGNAPVVARPKILDEISSLLPVEGSLDTEDLSSVPPVSLSTVNYTGAKRSSTRSVSAPLATKTRRIKEAPSLAISIEKFKNIGKRRAQDFAKLGVANVGDLLFFFPRDYQDLRHVTPIKDLIPGEQSIICGQVVGTALKTTSSRLTIIKSLIEDDSGEIAAIWFNQRYLENKLTPGRRVILMGKPDFHSADLQFRVTNVEFLGADAEFTPRIEPVYPLSGSLTQRIVRSLTAQAVKGYVHLLKDNLPLKIVNEHNWPYRAQAISQMHFPSGYEFQNKARRRLAFEELLTLQLAIMGSKEANDISSKIKVVRPECSVSDEELLCRFADLLPFAFTSAQKRVIQEIFNDMNSVQLMSRLVQGDVGSGKTLVAAAAAYKSMMRNEQAALMAPTEILAQQHYQRLLPLLLKLGFSVALLMGSTPVKERAAIVSGLRDGEINFVIGTHALIQDDIVFRKLGLAITDEQHRFGVMQRARLRGEVADMLVMTATPIPRTLALTIYADLHLSVIDELPPGRKPVKTYALGYDYEERITKFMAKEVAHGRQVYVVCPLVEDSEKMDLESAGAYYEKLQKLLPEYTVGLLHGKMKQTEKAKIMESFTEGKTQILVSTTVIEVGVDVPNASLMIIRDAQRFGLAQLHQLRGRIGRGSNQSYCVMLHNASSDLARKRMKTIVECSDGFALAEADLRLRGPGEFFGTRQHGLPELRVASLSQDADLLEEASVCARAMLNGELEYPDQLQKEANDKLKLLEGI